MFCKNKYIANILNVTHERVSKIISSLKDKGFRLRYKKDNYRQLQDSFYKHVKANNFNLERGKEEGRVHLSVEEYKK